MRNHYLVSYDVTNDRRLRRMYKKMRGFGEHMQYSVFLCALSGTERIRLLDAVHEIIHHDKDRVMIVNLGPAEGRGKECIEFIGRRGDLPGSGAKVVG
jgi:CRISPR-associated protein Cas2